MVIYNAKHIAKVLGGVVTGPHQISAPGPGHSKADRSLSIKIEPTAPGGLLIHSFANDPFHICRDYVYSALEIHSDSSALQAFSTALANTKSKTEAACRLWNEATEARGSLAEHYLHSRGLLLPEESISAIRFHPDCTFGPGERQPCMLALFRDISTNEPRALLRTALDANGRKIARKVLGPKRGCAIKLFGDADISAGLTIGEGVETTLAGILEGFRPAWAVGDAGEMARFPVLPGIRHLWILVDNDLNGKGHESANACSERWCGAGVRVQRVIPDQVGADIADVVAAARTVS